jgi:hypothetical protein
MATYARLQQIDNANIVVELITPPAGVAIGNMFTPQFVATLIDVTQVVPQPQIGWIYTNTGTWTAP